MRIRSLRLHPFAAQIDLSVSFEPGLNVITGPNEAGKSTLLNALQAVLLTPSKIGKRDRENAIDPFMPLSGGDTIRLSLEFSEGDDYELMKSWGGMSSAHLKKLDGESIEDPLKVEDRLAELLELKQGTWRNVLFAGQSDLTSTLKDLDPDDEVFGDLASWLRQSAFATDGMSIEEFCESLTQKIEAYEDHWDVSLARPEKGRGIDHPWEMKVGEILRAWYDQESIRSDRDLMETYERQLDAVTARTNERTKGRDELAAFVNEHSTAIKDANARVLLEAKHRALVAEGKGLKKVSMDWPKLEERRNNLEAEQVKANKQVIELGVKLKKAEVYEKNRSRRERLQRAEAKTEALKVAEKELAAIKGVSDQQVEQLKSLDELSKQLETGLAAGKLKLSFTAKNQIKLQTNKDLDEESEQTVKKGGTLDIEAGGRILLRHEDWEMTVQSGDSDFSDLKKRHQAARSEFELLLNTLGEKDFKSAQLLHRAGQDKKNEVEALRQQVNEILEGESFKDLKKVLGKEDEVQTPRPSAEIAAEKARLEAGVETAHQQMAEIDNQLATWLKTYKAQEGLLDLLIDKRAGLKDLETKLEALKPLPEGVENADRFIADYCMRENKLKQVMEDLHELKIDRVKLEGEAPDQSLKELEEGLLEAETTFERAQTEWKALLRIREVYQALREEMDGGTFDPWMKKLKELSETLSGGRYKEIDLNDRVAGRANEALAIPYDSLSTGTRACLGLAMRLSMAQHFLEERDGFVILDDPMVDLDPERQKAASLILQEFAKDKQLIVLTCHPGHAEQIGGHVIKIG